MKLKNKLILLIVLAISGCGDKFFEEAKPQSSLVGLPVSNADLESRVAGAYYLFTGNDQMSIAHAFNRGAMQSDEGYLYTERASVNDIDLYFSNVANTNIPSITHAWHTPYKILAVANEVIETINNTGGKGFDDSNQRWVPRMYGEAHFYRAFAHFQLIKIFGPPYKISGGNATGPAEKTIILKTASNASTNLSRTSVEAVYAQMISDINTAIAYLPRRYNPSIDPPGYQDRANRYAAHFLAMRINFQMGNFAQAKIHADSVLAQTDLGYDKLYDNPIAAFTQVGAGSGYNPGARELVFYFGSSITARIGNDLMFNSLGNVYHYPWFYWPSRMPPRPTSTQKKLSLSNYFLDKSGWNNHNLAKSNDKRYGPYSVTEELDVRKLNDQTGVGSVGQRNTITVNQVNRDRDGILGNTQLGIPFTKIRHSDGLFQRYDNNSSDTADHDPVFYIDFLNGVEDGIVDFQQVWPTDYMSSYAKGGARPTAIWCMKFNESKYGYVRNNASPGNSIIFNHPLYRSAEAYLTRAYCRLKTGGDWQSDLNVVRNRAYPGGTSTYDSKGYSDTEKIEIERMIEMVFEDDRIAYLQITRQVDNNFGEGLNRMSTGDRPIIRPGFPQTISIDEPTIYWRPPLSETQNNSGL